MTRRCFPYEIWRVFYNLARPVANSLVDGWKQFSSAQVQNGWVPHVYLGTRLLVLLFLLKESWYTRWKPLKIEYFFFPFREKKARQLLGLLPKRLCLFCNMKTENPKPHGPHCPIPTPTFNQLFAGKVIVIFWDFCSEIGCWISATLLCILSSFT